MTKPKQRGVFTKVCLIATIAVPVLYFGTQLVAAPYFEGYSFARNTASMLGTGSSKHPWIFNLGAILTGIAALLGAIGLFRAFRATSNLFFTWFISLAVTATGVMSIKAGLFPMPDPRHASWGFLVAFTIALPLLLLMGLWRSPNTTALRLYLGACIVLVLGLFPILSGLFSFAALQAGTLQRLFAFATFAPVGVVGYFFLRQPERYARLDFVPDNPT